MELTAQRRKETGAFYTPKVWADMAVTYFKDNIKGDLSDYVFWDMAGGEGALLDALPHNVRKIGTTLELEDMLIMRSKGIESYQFDFLDGDLYDLPFYKDLDPEKLIVFTNPPYFTLKASHDCYAKRIYKNNKAEELFLYRILMEIDPKYLGIFTKAGTIQLPGELYFDTNYLEFFRSGFASCSKQGWGLAGNFGILFSLFYFDWEQLNINRVNKSYNSGWAEGVFYTYWTDNPENITDTRTDIENLGQYIEKFDIYIR